MLRLRPFLEKDTDRILSWCRDERTFYQWTAGVMGEYPLTRERFLERVQGMIAFCAMEETEIVGFLTMRNPNPTMDELRFGFVIVDPERRGRSVGSGMLRLAVRYAFEIYGANFISLGVFENNPHAYRCYRAVGFRETGGAEEYPVCGEIWKAIDLEMGK